ncbi:hypothetical protein GGH96_004385 [Coemansia sp. RSA 1972]|nr:hypothetical protein GGH96_004385 [Coemansia sp. RSA 1972]
MRAISAANSANATSSVLLQAPSTKHCHSAVRRQPHNCTFIREQCAGYGHGLINYVEQYYCVHTSRHSTLLALLTLWLSLLFIWLGVSASEYFSPNISTLAKLLHLPESLAGVTLLALGNGAPDLSSTYSAVRAGSAALAIGQIVGSAAFIVSVVVCATTLAVPVYKVSRLSYLRELCFFVATVSMVAIIVLSERLTQTMAVFMVALYAAYVLTVVITTYYEEKCLALELDAEAQCAAQRLHEEQAESMFMQHDNQGVHSVDSVNEHTSLLWSDAAIPTNTPANRRRNTIGGIDTDYEDRDLWDLELLRAGSSSAKALGDFLQLHRKSLLAAAECSDILGEICGLQSHTNPAFRITPARDTLSSEDSTDNRLNSASRFQQIRPTPSSSVRLHSRSRSHVSSSSQTPSPWKSYTMQPPATEPNTAQKNAKARSQFGEGSPFCQDERQFSPFMPVWRPRLLAVDTTSVKTSSLPTCLADRLGTTLSPQLHDPATLKTRAVYLQGRLEPRSSLSHEPDTRSPCSYNLGVASRRPRSAVTEMDPPQCYTRYPVGATVESPTIPLQIIEPAHRHVSSNYDAYSVSCKELLESSGSKMHAVFYTCIPTLRFWLPGASVPLKAFIAFSALPVLILTLTVPVVIYNFHGHVEETQNGCNDDASNGQRAGPASSVFGCSNDGQEERLVRSLSSAQIQPHSASASTQYASDTRSLHASPLVPTTMHVQLDHEKVMADIEWAETAVSYVQSAVSTIFLCGTLYVSGYLPQISNTQVRAVVGVGIAGISLLANYTFRAGPLRPCCAQFVSCLAGFASGLVWVAVIADEIVSITQALGLILGLSEEILGLTIVGFGNSLGDLVTNLTLARMGYPMMALSACFGGPMLCLLLGVGVAACGYMTRAGLNGSFEIPFTSPTILVSTVCLLFNSVLFLISIPRYGYHMTRAIGLVALSVYLVGMAVNIYIEW